MIIKDIEIYEEVRIALSFMSVGSSSKDFHSRYTLG